MGKQPRLLEDIADAAMARRQIDALRRVQENSPVDDDAASVRPQQASDDRQQGRLAGAGRSADRQRAATRDDLSLDGEGAERMGDVDLDHNSLARLETRAANISEAMIAPNAMAMATSVSRTTLVSAPGCCV